jgi:site-specific DNA-methyltransferase (adenine-specific)
MSGETSRGHYPAGNKVGNSNTYGKFNGDGQAERYSQDTGGASRFFYVAKASKADREEGNNHPTVKPIALMRPLVRLVTPPVGIVLDHFMGSGSTGKAALLEGFNFVGIDTEMGYCKIAEKRLGAVRVQPPLLDVR